MDNAVCIEQICLSLHHSNVKERTDAKQDKLGCLVASLIRWANCNFVSFSGLPLHKTCPPLDFVYGKKVIQYVLSFYIWYCQIFHRYGLFLNMWDSVSQIHNMWNTVPHFTIRPHSPWSPRYAVPLWHIQTVILRFCCQRTLKIAIITISYGVFCKIALR